MKIRICDKRKINGPGLIGEVHNVDSENILHQTSFKYRFHEPLTLVAKKLEVSNYYENDLLIAEPISWLINN